MSKLITSTAALTLAAAAAASTLMLAVSPAWVPAAAPAHDGLRTVELPRVVISAQRERVATVVELPRVVVSAKREAQPAQAAGASMPVVTARATGSVQPVLSRQPY